MGNEQARFTMGALLILRSKRDTKGRAKGNGAFDRRNVFFAQSSTASDCLELAAGREAHPSCLLLSKYYRCCLSDCLIPLENLFYYYIFSSIISSLSTVGEEEI